MSLERDAELRTRVLLVHQFSQSLIVAEKEMDKTLLAKRTPETCVMGRGGGERKEGKGGYKQKLNDGLWRHFFITQTVGEWWLI